MYTIVFHIFFLQKKKKKEKILMKLIFTDEFMKEIMKHVNKMYHYTMIGL